MPVSVVKIASCAACRSTAAPTSSGRIRSSGLSKTDRTLATRPLLSKPGSASFAWRERHVAYSLVAFSRCDRSVLVRAWKRSAASTSALSPTTPSATRARRPMWAASRSTWMTVLPSGSQSGYGKSVPTISSTSPPSKATFDAGLPMSPDCPTW